MWFQRLIFLKGPRLHFIGEALGILYNQTFFVQAWNIYSSDECTSDMLYLTCPSQHSFLLAGKIILIQATDCRHYMYILFLGSVLGPHPGISETLESLVTGISGQIQLSVFLPNKEVI